MAAANWAYCYIKLAISLLVVAMSHTSNHCGDMAKLN